MNRHPRGARQAAPAEAAGTAPVREPDESLVLDARAGLTPADMVERTLQYRLEKMQGAPEGASSAPKGAGMP